MSDQGARRSMSNFEMSFVDRVFTLIDDLELGGYNQSQARQRIAAIIADCGFEYYTITRLPQPKLRLGPAMLIKRWPDSWLNHYDKSGYYKHDPVGKYCFETLEPFMWVDARCSSTDHLAARVMNEAAEHGLRHGFCVPMQGLSGFQAVASYAGRQLELSSRQRKALHLLSIAAYGWAERLERAHREASGTRLSPRERDVLIWTAVGLTNGEVSERLGISVLTVRTHLDRARVKLGAVNAVNAVVEALRRREIRV